VTRHVGVFVGVVLAGLALGPLLVHRGYVLIGDMVFLPHPPLTRSLLGISAGVPRAVPSDLVAALAAHLLPGDVAQKLLLVAVFVLAASGGARLLSGCSLVARVTAAAVLAWNPYVAERLALGQWAVLLGYAALPWVLVAAARLRDGSRTAWPALVPSMAVAALTPTGGLVAVGAALLVLLCGSAPAWRAAAGCAAAAVLLNAPWLLPALLRPTALPAATAGVRAFAARPDTPLGLGGSLATLGGIWSSDAVPPGRGAAGLVPVLLLLLAGVVAGSVLLVRGRAPLWSRSAAIGLLLAALASLLIGAAGATPGLRDALRRLIETVPAAGLLRDGPRHLGPLAVLEAVALGLAAEALARQLPVARRSFAALVAVVPVLVLPGLCNGVDGLLVTARYPGGWQQARAAVAADGVPGALLALPWSAYRAPAWNSRRTVLDPATKSFGRRVLADDRLRVGRSIVAGEDPRAAQVTPLATASTPLVPAAEALGVRWVLVERDSAEARLLDLRMAGADLAVDTPALALWRLPHPAAVAERLPPAVPVELGDAAALLLVLGAAARWALSARRGQ
jgi:hypothetical protein